MAKSQHVQDATTTTTPRPVTTRPKRTPDALLLEFLRDNDAACPVCGYNVRALTRPICPECRQELVLTVGARRLGLGWLFVALAPGFFSGIAACFVAIPIIGMYFEDGVLVPPLIALDLFGWCSGLFAIILAFHGRWRTLFIAQSRARQRVFALTIWLIHIAVFVLFIFALAPLI